MANELVSSGARTTSGVGPAANAPGGLNEVSIFLDVTAASGVSPSLVASVEWSHNGTDWFATDPAEPFVAMTAAGKRVRLFKINGDYLRLAWTITGTTPSITFAAYLSVSDFD